MSKAPQNYVPYHIHSMLSSGTTNIDSITNFRSYVEAAKNLGMKALGISEHGNTFEWLHKKEAIEAAGMKYLHCVEAYLTEDNDDIGVVYSAKTMNDPQTKKDVTVSFSWHHENGDGTYVVDVEDGPKALIGKQVLINPETIKVAGRRKTRDNYHCVLIAKNEDGFREINEMMSRAWNRDDWHFYYAPRISFEELFDTSDNILVTTACLGSALHNGSSQIIERFLSFLVRNKHRCFLEIQHHNCDDQREYNQYLYEIHKSTGIPLITGTDTHDLNDEHTDGRIVLQAAKDVYFENEDSWDKTFKSIDELIAAYKRQNSLPMNVVYDAIEQTNIMADMVDEFTIDRKAKYPKLYTDSEKVFKQKINEGVKWRGIQRYPNYREYVERIHEEYDTYKHNNAIDFMLLEEDYKSEMRRRNVKYGYSRGSVSGSVIAYLLGITEVDSIKFNLNFSRFMNRERVSLADIDTDWLAEDREIVKEYLFSKEGLYCCDIVTFNTIAEKDSINNACRGLHKQNLAALPDEIRAKVAAFKKENDKLTKNGKAEKAMPEALEDEMAKYSIHKEIPYDYQALSAQINKLYEVDPEGARKKYKKIFHYVDLFIGVVVSVGNHPAGCVVSPFPVESWFGTFSTKGDKYPVSVLNMKEIDSLNFVKLDILGLDNIGLIYKTCEAAGIPFLTPDNTPPDDMDVWNSIKEDTTMIFQWESPSSTAYLKQLFSDETIERIREKNPNFSYMDLLSIGNGAIRPAGESYRDNLAMGIYQDNGHEALNTFLDSTLGYLVYQEQVMEFLHSFCGYTMGEADVVRRCVEENTLVTLASGKKKPIRDIEIGESVVTIDCFGRQRHNVVVDNIDNGMRCVLRIETLDRSIIEVTHDHPMLTQRGWVEAGNLMMSDRLMALNIDTAKWYGSRHYHLIPILSIERAGVKHVYDLSIEENHNFVANGLIVHNCFAKKLGTESHIPKIKEGFIKMMLGKYDVQPEESERLVVNFIKVIEDASSYLFSKNHADPYSWIGYICGYLRHHYPLEFITTALNIFEGNEDKSLAIIDYAKRMGIRFSPIRFRKSVAQYNFNKDANEIYKGISSIGYMNSIVADELYALRNKRYDSFIDLLWDLKSETSLGNRQIKILIDLDFFEEFGHSTKLLKLFEFFESIRTRAQIKKSELANIGLTEETVRECGAVETKKLFKEINMRKALSKIDTSWADVKPRNLKETIKVQIEHLGYIDIASEKYAGMAVVLDVDGKYTPKVKLHSLRYGDVGEYKIGKRDFNKQKLENGDIIRVLGVDRNRPKSRKNENGDWEKIPGTKEAWITSYRIL